MSTTKKLAVLIDADNISADVIEYLLLEINKFGIASVKRIYGDWTDTKLNKWKDTLLPYAITPIQQFAYTNGKMPPIWPWSSMPWTCFTAIRLMAFAWCPATVISPAWPHAFARMVLRSSDLDKTKPPKLL